jgi:flagellum-specific peptidoglycan hydrolase FlgJ
MKERLEYWLRFAGFSAKQSSYLVAQAAHETGNFTSPVFLANNNFFGMRHPSQRRTLSTGSNLGHAKYKQLQDSVNDFRMYWDCFGYPSEFRSIPEYVDHLKAKGYFTDSRDNYLRGVTHFYKLYYNGV